MLTNEYKSWVSALKKRYRATQIKAAVAVNSAMLEFYWSLGADISRIYPGKKRNLNFFENLSNDLCLGMDNPKGLSVANIRYAYRFYELYSRLSQVAVNADYLQQVVEDKTPGEHLKCRRYLVIELKAVNFKPEHVGQLGFYMVAVDRQLKNEWDAPTIGLVLCRDDNRTVVEYALSATVNPLWAMAEERVAMTHLCR
jgi:hypothetical protein